MTTFTPALIDGEWVAARDGAVMQRCDPAATDEVVAEVPSMGPDDVAVALDAAQVGARRWADLGAVARGRVLLDAARLLVDRRDDIVRDVVREMGKTLPEATAEAASAAAFFEYFGGHGRAALGEVLPDRRPDVDAWSMREPLGVVALITPWNDPVATPARKLAPALISGNAVVLKPSPETPLSALHVGRALVDAGLPAGVLNIVTGEVERVARPLLDDRRVAALSFTGSTQPESTDLIG